LKKKDDEEFDPEKFKKIFEKVFNKIIRKNKKLKLKKKN
jgi:hypothetical protein